MSGSSPSPEAARPHIWGSIDSFAFPAGVSGWALKRDGNVLVPDLRIEVVRDGSVVATGLPTNPRPDLISGADFPAAFAVDCGGAITAEELLAGSVTVRAVDAAGNSARLPLWDKVREEMESALRLQALREVDGRSATAMLEALADNPNLPAELASLLRDGCAVERAGPRVARAPRKPRRKIVFLGAGSTVFAKNLLGDILLHRALADSHICLYDIDAERLRVSDVVANRIRQTLRVEATIESTLDLDAALDGADYAFNMIQVGGYRPCTVTDFEVPKRFGLRQTIADTLGVGGIMRGLRTIPVLLKMTEAMQRCCPDVLHLNYANPMAINCWALSRASAIRTVGLCHSIPHTAGELARDIGVPVETVDYRVAGINHMAFYLTFEAGGRDLYPLLRRVADEGRVPPSNRVRYDMLRRLGYFVTESSEHFAEYVPWYIKRGQEGLIERFNIPLDEYPRRCELQLAEWDALSRALTDPSVPLRVERSLEYGATIINAIETGEPAVIYGNVPNSGLITNLPDGCCVEVPCLVDHNGVQPVPVGALPPQLAALMQTNVNVQALTVEAALTGRREHVYHAAMLDPHTAAELSLDQIYDLVDAMLEAHRAWLPPGYF